MPMPPQPELALEQPLPGERYCAGLDFAGERLGGDSTVLTIGRQTEGGLEVVAVECWTGTPFETQVAAVAALARAWQIERLVCDATGLGAALTAQLRGELGRIVEPLVFTRAGKSVLGFALQAAAATGRLAIPRAGSAGIGRLWRELRLCRVERAGHLQISWAAPQGEHDDCVASLALCLRAAEGFRPERRAVGRSRAS